MYLVLSLITEGKIQRKEEIEINFQNKEQGIVGFLPIFETYEQAKKMYPDAEIIRVEKKVNVFYIEM